MKEICREELGGQEFGSAFRDMYEILAAEIVDDFETRFIKLMREHPGPGDFYCILKLAQIVGMDPKSRDAEVIRS